MRGTREGDEASRRYNAQLALHTLRFAINGNLRSPPAGFEEAVCTHFRLLRWRILRQVGAAFVLSCAAEAVGVHWKLACTFVSVHAFPAARQDSCNTAQCQMWPEACRWVTLGARVFA